MNPALWERVTLSYFHMDKSVKNDNSLISRIRQFPDIQNMAVLISIYKDTAI